MCLKEYSENTNSNLAILERESSSSYDSDKEQQIQISKKINLKSQTDITHSNSLENNLTRKSEHFLIRA